MCSDYVQVYEEIVEEKRRVEGGIQGLSLTA
jgi:hypothetical protein